MTTKVLEHAKKFVEGCNSYFSVVLHFFEVDSVDVFRKWTLSDCEVKDEADIRTKKISQKNLSVSSQNYFQYKAFVKLQLLC